jgi:hypothetical protein
MFLRSNSLLSSQPNGWWRILDRESGQLLINAVTEERNSPQEVLSDS